MADATSTGRRRRTPKMVEAVARKRGPGGGGAGKGRRGRAGFGTWILRLLGLALLLGVAGAAFGAGVFVFYGLDPEMPHLESAADYRPKVVTRVVDREGELLGEIFDERRTVVARKAIPDVMVHAIIDAEDAQFFQHGGLNYWGMLRALVNNLQPGAHLQGASTITQQLVKTYLLKTHERTIKRKVQEAILARRLEEKLSKDEILWLYLNQIYFGHARYGVEEAARFYFGKSVSDVNAGEAALLASLPKGPEEISPLKHPERAKERQRYVLTQMLRYGHVTREAAEKYAQAPIEVVRQPASLGTAPEFVDEARRALSAKHGDEQLPFLGLTVRTTCDAKVQRLAREALERNLEALDERQKYRDPLERIKTTTPDAIRAALRKRALKRLRSVIDSPTKAQEEKWLSDRDKALSAGKVAEAVVVEVREAAPKASGSKGDDAAGLVVSDGDDRAFVPMPVRDGKSDRYNPKALSVDKRHKVGDVITVRVEATLGKTAEDLGIAVPEFGPQGAVTVIDVETREVRALVGGYGFRAGGYNRATMAKRQPGSAFKPFLYAAAFASEKYTPASVFDDKPEIYELADLKEWRPRNAESHEFMGQVRLRTALARSLNTVASQLTADLTPAVVAQVAKDAGIASKLDETLSLGLGSSVTTLIEMTNAYATFAAGGRRAPWMIVSRVGDEVLEREPAEAAIRPEVAYLVTSMLRSVIDEGTAASAKSKLKGRPAAGKTGTTSSERDAWFVGYTPELAVGVWVGFDDMRDLGRGEQGARSALPVWVDVVNGALKGVPTRDFAQPAGIEVRKIDPRTGLLAAPGAKDAFDEVFLPGTAPTLEAPAAGEQSPDTYLIDQMQ